MISYDMASNIHRSIPGVHPHVGAAFEADNVVVAHLVQGLQRRDGARAPVPPPGPTIKRSRLLWGTSIHSGLI